MEFSNTGGMRSPFSPRVRQSIAGRKPIGMSARKNQSNYASSPGPPSGDVIYKTSTCTLETYGSPLPVLVTETLTFASSDVSVRISPCGWCWVVAGRRVVAWPREPSGGNGVSSPAPASAPAARELTLPQTDLAHKADLVELFYEEGAQMPSCVGVSPEGVVRYWWSVGHSSASVDVSLELAGQECERLLATGASSRLLLATTTCTLLLLQPRSTDGRCSVSWRIVRPPSGWLGGIGRRVSLLFFGSMPTHAETKLVGVVVLSDGPLEASEEDSGEEVGCVAVVGSGGGAAPLLQVWRGAELHEHSLRRPLAEAHARAHHAPHGELNSVELTALDVRGSGSTGLLMLIAACSVARPADTRHAIAHISVEDPANPRVTWLLPVAGRAPEPRPARLLPLPAHHLLHSRACLALVCHSGATDKVEYIDVSSEGDRILGAELCGATPLVFSNKHGLLALTTQHHPLPPSVCDSPMGSPCPSDMYDGNLSLYEIDPHEVSMVTTDACGKLKTAFLFHLRRDTASCKAIIDELFPPPPPAAPPSPGRRAATPEPDVLDVDNVLDTTVISIATEMLDDIPAGDPRWKSRTGGLRTRVSLGSSSALQHQHQLRDKQRALTLLRDFLRATGLLQRLARVTAEGGGGVVNSVWVLCSLAERLSMAMALRRLQQSPDIEAAIYQVVCGENSDFEEDPEVEAALSSGALSPSDVCYRRVTKIPQVLRALAARACQLQHDARAAAAAAARALHVTTTVLSAAHKTRVQWGGETAAIPFTELHAPFVELITISLTRLSRSGPAGDGVQWQVREAAAALADRVLADAAPKPHHTLRRHVITPFVTEGMLERAAVLAEKFQDLELLVEMCVDSGDLERLYAYIDKYADRGMAELAFSHIVDRGGGLVPCLLRCSRAHVAAALSAWLRAAPGRASLLALHSLSRAQLSAAAPQLAALAARETDSVCRLTTMASLAKLCLIASEEQDSETSSTRNKIESCLALAEQHEALPRDLRVHYGLDEGDTRVMQPEELLQMYIESESKSLTEYDMKKALDLTDYIQDMERRDELRLRVWCACIRHDDWSNCRVDDPALELHSKMFFRLIDLVHLMGGDLELLLPPVEDILTARELAELVSDARFHFMIKYGYQSLQDQRLDLNVPA